ncbi:MAG: hypothetical protein ACFFD2_20880 [Promethearchaeota archaeon]
MVFISGKRGLDGSQSGLGEYFWSNQYLKLSEYDYDLFLQITTIQKYIQKIVKMQKNDANLYYPTSNERVINYFKILKPDFDPRNIKYASNENIKYLSRLISNMGRSGYNYIKSYNNVIDLNKPVLLFYGIEHLASFYINLHLNFTEENEFLLKIKRRKLSVHGYDSGQFNFIKSNFELSDLINSRINLQKFGLASRFFLLLNFPMEDFFLNRLSISLIELLEVFFLKLRIGVPNKVINRFLDNYRDSLVNSKIKYTEDLDLFVFYSLAFLFSHLARYKMGVWKKILETEDLDFGFMVKFVMKQIAELFVRKIFSVLSYYDDLHSRILRRESK